MLNIQFGAALNLPDFIKEYKSAVELVSVYFCSPAAAVVLLSDVEDTSVSVSLPPTRTITGEQVSVKAVFISGSSCPGCAGVLPEALHRALHLYIQLQQGFRVCVCCKVAFEMRNTHTHCWHQQQSPAHSLALPLSFVSKQCLWWVAFKDTEEASVDHSESPQLLSSP